MHNRASELIINYNFRSLEKINNALQELIERCSGTTELRKISESLFCKTIRIYYDLVNSGGLDWKDEVQSIIDEVAAVLKAIHANDGAGVGFIRCNCVWVALSRITGLVPEE